MLVVDDDPAFRNLCAEGLERRADLSPVAASTPGEALAVLGGGTVDAVVSDVSLPSADGDGVDLYRAIRERWPALPFVFFTGTPAARLSVRVDLRADPAVDYVRKGCLPERSGVLGRRVERAVDRSRAAAVGEGSALRAIERFCR